MIKPLLAYKPNPEKVDELIHQLHYPLIATPKIDGIRCIIQAGNEPSTRSLKPIPNLYIREQLRKCPSFIDGELTCGTNFQAVTSGIMTHTGQPSFIYFIFDSRINEDVPYFIRTALYPELPNFCQTLTTHVLHKPEHLFDYEKQCLENGAEGVMLRSFNSRYKQGRSTLSEHYLIAIKRFQDSEAIILSLNEAYKNNNEAKESALGLTQRSSHQDNLSPKNTLGSFAVEDVKTKVRFKIGTGFDQALAKQVWDNPAFYIGKLVKYRSQLHGAKDKPRIPSFIGFRDEKDL